MELLSTICIDFLNYRLYLPDEGQNTVLSCYVDGTDVHDIREGSVQTPNYVAGRSLQYSTGPVKATISREHLIVSERFPFLIIIAYVWYTLHSFHFHTAYNETKHLYFSQSLLWISITDFNNLLYICTYYKLSHRARGSFNTFQIWIMWYNNQYIRFVNSSFIVLCWDSITVKLLVEIFFLKTNLFGQFLFIMSQNLPVNLLLRCMFVKKRTPELLILGSELIIGKIQYLKYCQHLCPTHNMKITLN